MTACRTAIRQATDLYLEALATLAEARPDDAGAIIAFRQAVRTTTGIAQTPALSFPEHPDSRSHALASAKIDIVVPVHNALADVRACVRSLRAAQGKRQGLVWLVDDASDDETATWLAAQQDGTFRYLRLARNTGFTAAVAAGLAQSQAALAVVLNSDTLVSEGWLEALALPFASRAQIALTGPLSNAAAWQSLGRVTDGHGLFATNLLPEGIDAAAITAVLKQQIGTEFVDLPIVHGFCFMLARDAYDAVGGFDLDGFGRGYGETQDLCLRLRQSGYRIGVVSDAFVQHGRSASYSDDARKSLSDHARRVLYRKHGALDYLRSEAACIDNPELSHIRATAAGWFAGHGLDISYYAADSARPTEFAEIANRSAMRRSGQRAGKSLIGLPRSGGVELVSLDWSATQAATRTEQASADTLAAPTSPQSTLPLAVRWISTLEPLESIVASWRHKQHVDTYPKVPPHLDSKAIAAAIRQNGQNSALPKVMISLGHDNYLTNRGGVQFCIQQEAAAARDRGVAYLNLHPSQPLPRLAHVAETPDPTVNLVLNGTLIGQSPMSEVIKATKALVANGARIDVVVHHLLGHLPELVADLVQASRNPCWFWLHDYFALCPGFTLLRNDLTYCAAPPVSSNACQICLYGEERSAHLQRIRSLAATVDLRLISPSEFMTRHFRALQPQMGGQITTVPHMEVLWHDMPANREAYGESNAPLTIAFLGNPAFHKGWQAFRTLSQDVSAVAQGVRFLHLGAERKAIAGIDWQCVQVSAQDPEAMVQALTENAVDFVFHWANWPETFSFTTFEALAAGAWVITRPESGNVAATMAQIEPGLVFPDDKALLAALADGRLAGIAADLRRKRAASQRTSHRSAMTFAAMEQAGAL
jgi:GT2 family glycosyltransferase